MGVSAKSSWTSMSWPTSDKTKCSRASTESRKSVHHILAIFCGRHFKQHFLAKLSATSLFDIEPLADFSFHFVRRRRWLENCKENRFPLKKNDNVEFLDHILIATHCRC
jgi:hypothetical protein